MPILFDTPFDESIIHHIGINNVVRYYSDNTVSPVTYSTIEFSNNGVPKTKTIFPGPMGKFFYNFKEMMQLLMVVNNFQDNISYTTQINNWTPQSYRREFLNIKVYFEDETFEEVILDSSWLACFFQYWDYKFNHYPDRVKNQAWILKPKAPGENPRVKYWVGYPFSIGFYTGSYTGTTVTGNIAGAGPIQYLGNMQPGTRLVISDGTLEYINLLPKANSLKFNFSNGSGFKINIDRISSDCLDKNKVYLKWLNSYGDFDYFLFDVPDRIRNTKSLGSIANDFNNFLQTSSPEEQIGFDATDSFDIYGTFSPDDIIYISDLVISPKIYLFIGEPGQTSSDQDWMEIKLKSTKLPLMNRKSNNVQHKFTIDMPELNTRKL